MEASREDGGVFFRLPLSPRDEEVWPVPIADGAGYFHEHCLGVASLLKALEELGSGCSECLDVRGGAKRPDDFSLDGGHSSSLLEVVVVESEHVISNDDLEQVPG